MDRVVLLQCAAVSLPRGFPRFAVVEDQRHQHAPTTPGEAPGEEVRHAAQAEGPCEGQTASGEDAEPVPRELPLRAQGRLGPHLRSR